jgi:hypothetical protein
MKDEDIDTNLCNCDVCGLPNVCFQTSSRMAPITSHLCSACRSIGAENIEVAAVWIATYGGPDKTPIFCQQLVAFLGGDYVEWEGIRKYYLENEEQILETLNEENVLVDLADPDGG